MEQASLEQQGTLSMSHATTGSINKALLQVMAQSAMTWDLQQLPPDIWNVIFAVFAV